MNDGLSAAVATVKASKRELCINLAGHVGNILGEYIKLTFGRTTSAYSTVSKVKQPSVLKVCFS